MIAFGIEGSQRHKGVGNRRRIEGSPEEQLVFDTSVGDLDRHRAASNRLEMLLVCSIEEDRWS